MKYRAIIVFKGVLSGILLFVFLSGSAFVNAATKESDVSAKGAYTLIEKNRRSKDFVILDIRTPAEFSQGHIENAVNIDFFSSDFKTRLNSLDRNKTYLFHCKSGGRSGRSIKIFKELKFKHIIHMSSGFDQWLDSSLPVVK